MALRPSRRTAREGSGLKLARIAVVAYLGLGIVGAALAFWLSGNPFFHPRPWLTLTPVARVSSSIALGTALAFIVVILTRYTVARFAWARGLHAELQPIARGFGRGEIWLVAGLSSLGEELFFRSFLVPTIGLVGATIAFGVLHQLKGKSRWVWIGWTSVVGALLGAIYCATGSVLGPLVAHALINAINLEFLRSYAVADC